MYSEMWYLILIAVLKVVLCQSNSNTWTKLDIQCFTSEAPVNQKSARSDTDCVFKAFESFDTGVGVAQFNKISLICSVSISYQSVCRFATSGNSVDCITFVRFSINIQPVYSKLTNLWVADGTLENQVCQIDKDTNKFSLINTIWASDGLKFDGTSSYMVTSNKSNIGFTGGLTWLMRLKRQPRVQPFFEFYDCSKMWNAGEPSDGQMWEYVTARQGYVRLGSTIGYAPSAYFSSSNLYSSSADDWMNVGFTTDLLVTQPKYFYNNAFVPITNYSETSTGSSPSNICVVFGKRMSSSSLWFEGTIRALAFANTSMTEAEIQQFFLMVT